MYTYFYPHINNNKTCHSTLISSITLVYFMYHEYFPGQVFMVMRKKEIEKRRSKVAFRGY
jgi:hypothetical protein